MEILNERKIFGIKFSRKVEEIILVAILVSFLGWIMETIYCHIVFGGFSDRGFLILPLCGIYGIPTVVVYCILGTPQNCVFKEKIVKIIKNKALSLTMVYLFYFIFSAVIATIMEFSVGFFYDNFFGFQLWSYSQEKFNFFGYVCLKFSLIWGLLLTIFMALVWNIIHKFVKKINSKSMYGLLTILLTAILYDYFFNYYYIFTFGYHLYLY